MYNKADITRSVTSFHCMVNKHTSWWLFQALWDVFLRFEELSHMDFHLFMKFKTTLIEQDIILNHPGYMELHKQECYTILHPKRTYFDDTELRSQVLARSSFCMFSSQNCFFYDIPAARLDIFISLQVRIFS